MSARNLPEATFARTVLGSGPALALAHGAGSSIAGTYGPILEGLAATRWSTSTRSTTPLSLDDLADQLVAAAVAEGLETFALHGYSLRYRLRSPSHPAPEGHVRWITTAGSSGSDDFGAAQQSLLP